MVGRLDQFSLLVIAALCLICINGSCTVFHRSNPSPQQIDTFDTVTFREVEEGITELCHSGVWVIYPEGNFTNTGEFETCGYNQVLPELDWSCKPFCPDARIGSVRAIGDFHNAEAPSATYFSHPNYEGNTLVITDDIGGMPILENPIGSILIVNTHVELFSKSYYQGKRHCLSLENCKDNVCWSWHAGLTPDLPFNITFAKSAKIGCTPRMTTIGAFEQTMSITFATGIRNTTMKFVSDHPFIPNENEVVQYCPSGLWVTYNGVNYTQNHSQGFGAALEDILQPNCQNPGGAFASIGIRSARKLGLPDGSPSVTFFSEKYYGGERTVVKHGAKIPVLPNPIKSLVTVNTTVLYFEEENFQGESVCGLGGFSGCRMFIIPICTIRDFQYDYMPDFIPKSAIIGCPDDEVVPFNDLVKFY